jgi:hypothetical protein
VAGCLILARRVGMYRDCRAAGTEQCQGACSKLDYVCVRWFKPADPGGVHLSSVSTHDASGILHVAYEHVRLTFVGQIRPREQL